MASKWQVQVTSILHYQFSIINYPFSMTKPYPGTQSVQRAISLLKLFTDEQPEWSLPQLVTATGLNRTTLYRLLTALESETLIARDEQTECYRLGSGLIVLGGRAQRANPLRMVSKGPLAQLAADTRETVTLEQLSGQEMVIIEEILGDQLLSGGQSVGTRWPVYATSTGRVLLAAMPPEDVAAVLPAELVAFTAATITDRAQLLAELAVIRQQGYAVVVDELEVGYVAVGAVVRDVEGTAVAAISIGGPKTRLTPQRLPAVSQQVTACARQISYQLGYRDD
ncbi:MAG: IclR family transcriptional regulator [Candidatus Promineifilaceae bacterium]